MTLETQTPQTDQPPISIRGLSKSFGDQKVLTGLDLTVNRGETVVILGRSGTGKSVLLKLIIGLQKPDEGSVRIAGQEITKLSMDDLNQIRKKMGFLFQQAALYDSLTVEDNVAFPLSRHTRLSLAKRKERVRELLSNVGMERDVNKMPSELSGGMQKRVGMARALALDPEILLFDEPTAGLDPITSDEIGKLISRMKAEREMTAIIVTHDVHGAKEFSNRFVMVHEGRIVVEGTLDKLRESQDPFVIRFLRGVV